MRINEKAIEYWDKEAFALLECMSVTQIQTKKGSAKPDFGSLAEQEPILKFSLVTNMIRQQGDFIEQSFGNKLIRFDSEQGKRFQKFVTNVSRDNEVKKCISRKFIHSKAWSWLAKTKNEGKAEYNFSNFLISEMENSIKTLKLYYPVVYLNIDVPFKIGEVDFAFFTSEYFDKHIEEYAKNKPGEKNVYVDMKKEYKGMVYTATTVTAEAGKAKEIALAKCSFAMDVLKICSNTLHYPHAKIDFDIDCRSNQNPQSEIIIESQQFMDGLSTNLSRPAHPYHLDQTQFKFIQQRKLEIFHNFTLNLKSETSELEKLIQQGIIRLAKALSNNNHFQRVAELFTVLESLLLLSEDSPIIDTVCKYASKLFTKDTDQRRDVIRMLKAMYGVRSAWVHHAKEKQFEMDDLRKLQVVVHGLLIKLIEKTKTHQQKQALLEEIDEAILGAY